MIRKLTRTWIGQGLLISLGATLLIYILRGIGLLSMMPGFVLLGLAALTLGFALLLSIQR